MAETTGSQTVLPDFTIRKLAERIERSGGGESDDLMSRLYGLLRATEFYGIDAPQQRGAAQRIVDAILGYLEESGEPSVTIQTRAAGSGGSRAKFTVGEDEIAPGVWFAERLLEYEIDGLAFDGELTVDGLIKFTEIVIGGHDVCRTAMRARLPGIRLIPSPDLGKREHSDLVFRATSRRNVLEMYGKAIARCRSLVSHVRGGKPPAVVNLKRLLYRLAEIQFSDPDVLMGLVHLRPFPGTGYNHVVNASLLSIATAQALGADRVAAAEAGICTAMALLSKMAVTSRETRFWWAPDYSPNDSLDQALLYAGMHLRFDLSSREATANFLATYEFSGERAKVTPPGWYAEELEPLEISRLIQVARAYDELVDPGYGGFTFSPEIALQVMIRNRDRYFSPTALNALIQTLGFFPPGTLVFLNDGSYAVVMRRPRPQAPPTRPVVRLVSRDDLPVVDLGRKEAAPFLIESVVDPRTANINPMQYFVL